MHVVQQTEIGGGIEGVIALEQSGLHQHAFHFLVTIFSQLDAALLLVNREIPLLLLDLLSQLGDEPVDGLIQLRTVVGGTGNNQWGAGFVNENGVHLVDNGKGKLALAFISLTERHVVAQIVEAKFVIGAVNDV